MSCRLKMRVRKAVSHRISQKMLVSKQIATLNDNTNNNHITPKPDSNSKINGDSSHFFQDNNTYKLTVKFDTSFFMQPCISLAQNLLGKILVRKLPSGELLKGKIVETESYLGLDDKACHSYKGKKTERNEAMFLSPGTAYVYTIYGIYFCFNITSGDEGSAVLIRALEPLEGMSTMRVSRSVRRNSGSVLKDKDLCNGPSKLCQALKIEKNIFNKVSLCTSEDLWIENGLDISGSNIISCKRIGIDSYGEEWANKPLRYYIKDCAYVSVRNKLAEKLHNENINARDLCKVNVSAL